MATAREQALRDAIQVFETERKVLQDSAAYVTGKIQLGTSVDRLTEETWSAEQRVVAKSLVELTDAMWPAAAP